MIGMGWRIFYIKTISISGLWKLLIIWLTWLESEDSFFQSTFYKQSGCEDKTFFHYKSIHTLDVFLHQQTVAIRRILPLRISENSHSVLLLFSKKETVVKIKSQQLNVFSLCREAIFRSHQRHKPLWYHWILWETSLQPEMDILRFIFPVIFFLLHLRIHLIYQQVLTELQQIQNTA